MNRHATPRGTWRARVVDAVPLPFLTHAYETAVAVVLCFIALPVVSGGVAATSIHAEVPGWMAVAWGCGLFAGAAMTLLGLFTHRPRLEWAGQLFLGYALTFYAAAITLNAPWDRGGVSVLVFGGLGVTAWWRAFKIASAPYVQYRLNREARAVHVQTAAARRRAGE